MRVEKFFLDLVNLAIDRVSGMEEVPPVGVSDFWDIFSEVLRIPSSDLKAITYRYKEFVFPEEKTVDVRALGLKSVLDLMMIVSKSSDNKNQKSELFFDGKSDWLRLLRGIRDVLRELNNAVSSIEAGIKGNIGKHLSPRELKGAIRRILDKLPEREREVSKLYFGLEDGIERNLDQVGERFGISRERVGQILQRVIEKLYFPDRDLYLSAIWRAVSGNILDVYMDIYEHFSDLRTRERAQHALLRYGLVIQNVKKEGLRELVVGFDSGESRNPLQVIVVPLTLLKWLYEFQLEVPGMRVSEDVSDGVVESYEFDHGKFSTRLKAEMNISQRVSDIVNRHMKYYSAGTEKLSYIGFEILPPVAAAMIAYPLWNLERFRLSRASALYYSLIYRHLYREYTNSRTNASSRWVTVTKRWEEYILGKQAAKYTLEIHGSEWENILERVSYKRQIRKLMKDSEDICDTLLQNGEAISPRKTKRKVGFGEVLKEYLKLECRKWRKANGKYAEGKEQRIRQLAKLFQNPDFADLWLESARKELERIAEVQGIIGGGEEEEEVEEVKEEV